MALLACHECAKPVSDQAPACPHCGAPVKKLLSAPNGVPSAPPTIPKAQGIAMIVIASIIVLLYAVYDSSRSTSPTAEPEVTADTCSKDDLQCMGEKGVIAAGVYCAREVEKLAKHSMKWTDGSFETKFSRFKWRDQVRGEVTYIGDKAEFQNGFGAFTPVIYQCDIASDEKTVLDVRVDEGRLP